MLLRNDRLVSATGGTIAISYDRSSVMYHYRLPFNMNLYKKLEIYSFKVKDKELLKHGCLRYLNTAICEQDIGKVRHAIELLEPFRKLVDMKIDYALGQNYILEQRLSSVVIGIELVRIKYSVEDVENGKIVTIGKFKFQVEDGNCDYESKKLCEIIYDQFSEFVAAPYKSNITKSARNF